MSSQYLSASITAIHGKQFEHRQTALPPYSTTILVCQTKCNVFLPPKIIPAAYMGSPRMGPNLPYKPAIPNRKTSHTRTSRSRKTSHTRTSRSRKTSHTRTTRSSLFPPYNNSRSAIWRVLTGTLPPQGSRLRPRVRVRLPGQTRCTERGR